MCLLAMKSALLPTICWNCRGGALCRLCILMSNNISLFSEFIKTVCMDYLKTYLFIFIIAFYTKNISAQTEALNLEKADTSEVNISPLVGIQVGPETYFTGIMPTIGLNVEYDHGGDFIQYHGADAGMWVVGSLWGHVSYRYGLRYGILTLDASLGYLFRPAHTTEGDVEYPYYSHVTLNPKIGIWISRVWLKVGPSIVFADFGSQIEDDFNFKDFTNINGVRMNFELLVNPPKN